MLVVSAGRNETAGPADPTTGEIPDHVYDDTPESRGAVEHAYRYDPDDDSGRPFGNG